jgi:hypothetical protein
MGRLARRRAGIRTRHATLKEQTSKRKKGRLNEQAAQV